MVKRGKTSLAFWHGLCGNVIIHTMKKVVKNKEKRRKKIIIGNWKMAPTTMKKAKAMFGAIKNIASKQRNVQTVICAPYIYLSEMKKLVGGHRCVLGAQNSFRSEETAHTGEVSTTMLTNIGVEYVILGHSERRAMFETDEIVNQKIKLCLTKGLKVVVCVGEKERDEDGAFMKFIQQQLEQSLKGINRKLLNNLIVAYEPIWAIGKKAKAVCSPEDFLEISIFIKKVIAGMYNREIAMNVSVLYGGSANPENSEEFLTVGEADGLLVGRASLNPEKFNEILEIANGIKV